MFKKSLKWALVVSIVLDFIGCFIDGDFSEFIGMIPGLLFFSFFPILIFNLAKKDKAIEKQKYIDEEKQKQLNEENNNVSLEKEYRKKCNVCGNIFCYTDKDIEISNTYAELSNSNRKMGIQSKVGSLIGMNVMNNNSDEKEKLAELYSNKVIDYSKCPKCGSSDLKDFKPKKEKSKKDE